MTYELKVTEKQLSIIQAALEEYFRLRMGQDFDFTTDFCSMGVDFSQENPNHGRIFDRYIDRRDAMREAMRAAFRIGYGAKGYLEEKTPDMLIAEDIWDSIRCARGLGRWGDNRPLHLGEEPPIEIKEVEEA